jgi:Fic family protein
MANNHLESDGVTESRGAKILFDLRAADAAYKPFPPFSEWQALAIDTLRWERYVGQLKAYTQLPTEVLQRAREIAKRAAAWDTGAIENLYETDRGFTFTVARQIGAWEAELDTKGKDARALFAAQLQAYDYVLDLATGKDPLVEAWIRELHKQLCKSQKTYRVYTEIGLQDQPLLHGEYKYLPNHVLKKDGIVHSYCPVDVTPAEMHRFLQALRSEAFQSAHPVLQAAYAHYVLVAIHPFADGNGRVARALASVYTYRAVSIPPLILQDRQQEYFLALEVADQGTYSPFTDFMFDRCLDAVQLVNECILATPIPPVSDTLNQIRALYMTRGGYSHQEVDDAGYKLSELARQELEGVIERHKVNAQGIQISAQLQRRNYTTTRPNFRPPVSDGGRRIQVNFASAAPAQARVERNFTLEIPQDCGVDDDLSICNQTTGEIFGARVNEVVPHPTDALQMRLRIWAERVLGSGLQELKKQATQSLKQQGY